MPDIRIQLPDGRKLIALAPSGLTEGDIIQYRGGQFVRVARQGAVGDIDDVALPGNGVIGSLTFSSDATGSECEALRDQVEHLRDVLASTVAQLHALRDRFTVSDGSGLIHDA